MNTVEITKQEFLKNQQGLIEFFISYWGKNSTKIIFKNTSKQHLRQRRGPFSEYKNFSEAYNDFKWGSDDFSKSTIKLLDLQGKIRNDIRCNLKGDLLAHLCKVLAWGGVVTKSIAEPLLDKYDNNELLTYFKWIYEKRPFDADRNDLSELENLPSNAGILLSNSGLTKIYCVIGSSCIIYDNRVSASLGHIITRYLGKEPLSAELSLVVGPKPRNPSTILHKFPQKGTNGTNILSHAKSNLVTNWLISSVVGELLQNSQSFKNEVEDQLEKCCQCPKVEADEIWMAMRIYESGLFMAGHTVPSPQVFSD